MTEDAKPGYPEPWASDVVAYIREELALGYAKALGIPMSLIDGRPWVPTHEEAHPSAFWGAGLDGPVPRCAHDDCEGDAAGWGRNLTGVLNP